MRVPSLVASFRYRSLTGVVVLLLGASVTVGVGRLQGETPVQFMRQAKLGLFVHYVYGLTQSAPGRAPVKGLNRFADDLNVQGIANMASRMGAQYVVFTAYHWRMNMLLRCPVWKKIFPSHVSKRDVVGDLAKALRAKGIKLVLYIHPDDRHDFTPAMMHRIIKLGWTSPGELKNIYSG
jgi:hypothetical protein